MWYSLIYVLVLWGRIFDICGILSYMFLFFGDFQYVIVVNSIAHRNCNVKGHIKKIHGKGSYICRNCGNAINYSYNL